MSSTATAPSTRRPDHPCDQPRPKQTEDHDRGDEAPDDRGIPLSALLAANRAAREVSTPPSP